MRAVRVLTAFVLAVAAALACVPAHAAAETGTLTLVLVDEHGDPMPGTVNISSGTGFVDGTQQVSSGTFPVPPGAYAVVVITPWGGMQCVGIASCDLVGLGGGTGTPDGSLVVAAGQDTHVEITGAKPIALKGPARVGTPLRLTVSEGLDALIDYLAVLGGGALVPTVTWLRDGQPIDGANETTYLPVGADVGKALSARMAYTGIALTQFEQISGAPVTPRTTSAVTVAKVPTKAFAILSNPVVKAGNRGKVRVEVTAKGVIVTGKARLSVGDWSQTRALRNGTARFLLPQLPAGKHPVQVRFLGTKVYDASTAQPRTLTVTR